MICILYSNNNSMKKISFLVFGIFLAVSGYSQEIKSYVISSAGAAIMGDGGALYLSIGEPMNTEISGGDIMISQGFLQVSIAQLTSDENMLEEVINAYPNPTSASLVIEMPEMDGQYQYQLFDLLGNIIRTANLNTIRSTVDVSLLDAGTYLLKVNKADKNSRTIKIVKL